MELGNRDGDSAMKKLTLFAALLFCLGAAVDDNYTLPSNQDTLEIGGAALAFRGAEGSGCDENNTHGRGDGVTTPTIYTVTHGGDSGVGSYRACAEATGPRYCIFEYGGNIELENAIFVNSDVYVAGQTAPAPGITFKNYTHFLNGSRILMRHVRFATGLDNPNDTRPISEVTQYGDNWCTVYCSGDSDCVGGGSIPGLHCNRSQHNIIIYGTFYGASETENICVYNSEIMYGWDRLLTISDNNNVGGSASLANNKINHITFAESMFVDPLRNAPSPNDNYETRGGSGATIAVTGAFVQDVSFIKNIFHGPHRSPLMQWGGKVLSVNNRLGPNSYYSLGFQDNGEPLTPATKITAVGNSFALGVGNAVPYMVYNFPVNQQRLADYYGLDNLLTSGAPGASEYDSANVVGSPQSDLSGINILSSSEVDDYVFANAGMRPGARDSVSASLISKVQAATTWTWVNCPRSERCAEHSVGYPTTSDNRALAPPLNPHDDDNNDGYTNLEEWLETYAASVE